MAARGTLKNDWRVIATAGPGWSLGRPSLLVVRYCSSCDMARVALPSQGRSFPGAPASSVPVTPMTGAFCYLAGEMACGQIADPFHFSGALARLLATGGVQVRGVGPDRVIAESHRLEGFPLEVSHIVAVFCGHR